MIALLVAFLALAVAAALVLRRELLRHRRHPAWEWFGSDDYQLVVTITADASAFIEGMRRASESTNRLAR